MKKVLTAGLALAAVVAFGDSIVTNSSELSSQKLDTRVIDGARTISSVDEIWPFALADEGTIIVTADGYPQTAETLSDGGDGTAVWAPLARATYTAVHASGQTAKFDLESTEGLPLNIFGYTVKCVPESFTYDGTVKEPSVTVSQGDDILTPGEDYTVAFESGSHVGAYRAVVTGINGRGGILRGTYTIQPQPSTLGGQTLDTRTDPVREANRFDDILPFVYIDDTTITVTRTNDGSTVEFVGAIDSTTNWVPSNFGFFAATNGSLSAAFRVDQLVCDFSFDGGTDEFDYQKGEEVKPAFTLRDGDYTLQEGTDYTAVYSNNINPGTATLTITGIGKYTAMGTVVKTFKIVFHPYSVSDSSQAGTLDTRTGESRILNGVAELQAFAYNNVPGWPKGGDTGADAATVRMTPMIGVAGGVANWFPADVPYTLATVAGENTLDWTPTDGFTCYKAEMLIGGAVVETAYLNLNGADFEERATVTVIGGEAMTVSVKTNDGQTLSGELTCRWYVYDPTNTWYEGVASTDTTFTPGPAHYEKAMRVLVFDDRGYAGMTETLWCSKLPVVYIDVEGGATITGNRTTKPEFTAQMRMQGNAKFKKEEYLYDGPMTIHVRGNTTADAEKKPYKIKLDSKANLLKMGKSKHWVLLSNPYDFSLMRNKVIYDFSAELGLTAMASEWVDVVMNGEYVGNYQLCEHIRVDEKRVDIYDWEGEADDVADAIAATNGFSKAATKELETYLEQHLGWVTAGEFTWTNEETYVLADYNLTNKYDITGGYLFEIDPFADEVTMFNTGAGTLDMLTKANRPEYLNSNPEMLDVARTIWSNYWAAIVSPDGYYRGVHYSQMCDLDSMAAFWLAQVLPAQQDYRWSRFAYKDNGGGLLTWGPAWDFDNACGGRDSGWTFKADGTIASRPNHMSGWYSGTSRLSSDVFFPDWNNDPYFVLKVWEKFNEVQGYLDGLLKDGDGTFDKDYAYLLESGIANAERWAGKITQVRVISPFMRFDGENGSAAWFKANLKSRVAWMKGEFASIRRAVASLNPNGTGTNRYLDSADKFAFDFVTPHVLRPVEGEGEGATPDIMLSNASNLETRVTLTGLNNPATVDVYVNGLSNGTYAVEGNAVAFEVNSNEFTNVDGHRNMISLVAKNASGTKLATTYSLVTTINEANYPQQISNATVTVEIAAEVPFTGEPYEPEVTVTTSDGVVLTNGLDYAVEYLNNVNPGTATVRITGLGNPYGTGEFPRGNWVGTVERTFTITAGIVSHDELTAQMLDTRANPVRKPASLDEILPFAWNDDSAWPTNGTGAGNAVVSVVPVAGEGTDPAAWTNAGPARTFVDKSGEGTNAWDRQYAKLYRASLVNDAGATTTLAYFDLTALDLPPDPVDLLRTAFGESVEITVAANGDPTVKMTEDLSGPVALPAEVGAFTLDVNGNTLSGTNGVNGSEVSSGTDGGPAIVVLGAGVEIAVTNTSGTAGGVVGGKGGNGNPPGNGAAAISGTTTVTDPQGLVTPGENGQPLEKAPEQKALEEAFKPNAYVEPMTNAEGQVTNYNVTVTNDITGPVIVPENVAAFIVDLDGHSITGTVGEVGSEATVGGEGTAAIVVSNAAAQVSVVGPGSITGGNGGAGNPPGEGAEAIVTSEGEKVEASVSGDAEVAKGEDGADLKSDEQKDLEEAFKPNAYVEPMTNAEGLVTNYNVVVTNDITGPVVVPECVNEFVISLDGHSITGAVGEVGSEATAGGDGTAAIVVSNAAAKVSVKGPGSITGGNGGAGNPPGEGAEAIVTSEGAKVDPVVSGEALVSKGEDGADLKSDEQKDLEEAFKPNAVVTPLTDDDGNVTNYNVTVTNDITGPVIVPEGVVAFIVDLDGHSITGTVGEVGGKATAGGEGTAAIVVSNASAQVSVVGPGSITGGKGGAGNPPGEGAEAIVTSAGEKVEASVSGDAEVAKGEDGADLKSDEQKDLEEAFKPNAVVTPLTDDDGNVTNYNVVVTNDITGPVVLPENVTDLILDLNGHSITGACGAAGGETAPGGDGAAAIVASNATVKVSVKGPGSITGGDGGAGNPPGEGGAAIADADGGTIAPASVTGGAKVAPGKSGYVAAAVEIVRVVTSHPWGGILNVEYVCARLRRGYAYKVSFFVTVDGEDKCWTVTLPTQDVSLESFRNTAVLRLDEKFGAGKRDPRAKIFATIDPIAVAE